MTTPLIKSARSYRNIVTRLPELKPGALQSAPYRDAADYLRELYTQYGRKTTRRAIEAATIDTHWLD